MSKTQFNPLMCNMNVNLVFRVVKSRLQYQALKCKMNFKCISVIIQVLVSSTEMQDICKCS